MCVLGPPTGLSVLDLAVQGESYSFVEKCCKFAIDFRWYGDLDPHLLSPTWLVLGLLSGGLAPALYVKIWGEDPLHFTPPPLNEATRRRTQRRARPHGYPSRPWDNKQLMDKLRDRPHAEADGHHAKLKKLVDLSKTQELSADDKEELWNETFTAWECWGCFMSAPLVLFLYNVCMTLFFTIMFVYVFMADRLRISKRLDGVGAHEAGHTNLELDDVKDPLTLVEPYLLVYFIGSLVREVTQVYVEVIQLKSWRKGVLRYILDYWNFMDIVGITTFFVGRYLRHACAALGCGEPILLNVEPTRYIISAPFPESHWVDWSLCYAICIFSLCFRVLRVLYLMNLGQIVSIFLAMMHDFLQFLVVYFVIIIAMMILFVGVADPASLVKQCSRAGVADGSDSYMSCISWFPFFRTVFQSFGEFFEFDGITNFPMIFFLIITFFITNVLLMNLLIAMMSATFNDKTEIAGRDQLVQRYWMVEEHTRRSFAAPVPFNIISTIRDLFAFFFVYRQAVRRKYPECSTAECFNLFVARNQPFKAGRGPLSWIHGHGHCLAQAAESEDESTHQGQDEVEERTFGQKISAFMERARTAVADEAYAPDTLLGKMSQISEDVKFVQRMQSNSALEGEPPPGTERLACPHLLTQ